MTQLHHFLCFHLRYWSRMITSRRHQRMCYLSLMKTKCYMNRECFHLNNFMISTTYILINHTYVRELNLLRIILTQFKKNLMVFKLGRSILNNDTNKTTIMSMLTSRKMKSNLMNLKKTWINKLKMIKTYS